MNKFGAVLGIAAVAALSGCINEQYVRRHPKTKASQSPASSFVEPELTPPRDTAQVKPVQPEPVTLVVVAEQQPEPQKVVIDATPVAPEPQPQPVKSVTTRYIVQRGDTLSKISKRFNIKIDAIKAANPQIKGDVIKLGQKLELPGEVEVGEQKVPEGAFAAPAASAPKQAKNAEFKPYSGATKEYTVKNGDSLSVIANSNGISVRQLRALNGNLSGDKIRIGQKLLIPAQKVEKKAAEPAQTAMKKEVEIAAAPVAGEPAKEIAPAAEPEKAEAAPAVQPAAEENDYVLYTVKEGEDFTGIALECDISTNELLKMNNLPDGAEAKPGMVIKTPRRPQVQ